MRWVALMIVAGLGCASAPASTSVTAGKPPDLTGYRLVSEWEAGPGRDDLRSYVRRRPLVRVTGKQEVIAFDDGAVFVEARNGADEDGFRKTVLSGDGLAALREDLARFCPTLVGGFMDCSHGPVTRVTCHLGSSDFEGVDRCGGADQPGRDLLNLASRVIKRLESRPPARPLGGADWYSRVDLERTLSPISYKRYVPVPSSQADVQQGVASDGALLNVNYIHPLASITSPHSPLG